MVYLKCYLVEMISKKEQDPADVIPNFHDCHLQNSRTAQALELPLGHKYVGNKSTNKKKKTVGVQSVSDRLVKIKKQKSKTEEPTIWIH